VDSGGLRDGGKGVPGLILEVDHYQGNIHTLAEAFLIISHNY